MDRRRVRAVAALAIVAALVGCRETTGSRTRRNFDETGLADLGEVQAYIDPGVVLSVAADGASLRLRANAPIVTLDFTSRAAEARQVTVELGNVADDSVVTPPLAARLTARHTLTVEVPVPAGGAVHFTVAFPAVDVVAPFHFAWVGDVQGAYQRFGHIRERIDGDSALEFVIFAGDVTENGTPEEVDDFVAAADELARPWYGLIGNHDVQGGAANFQRRIGRIDYAFEYRGAQFLLLDSASATIDARVYRFIDEVLAPPRPLTRVAAMHVPPFDWVGLREGGFASRAEAAKVAARLAGGGVDLLLCGHLHTLHFDSSAGIETVTSGNGGVTTEMRLDGTSMHYLDVSVDPARQQLEVAPVLVP